MADDSDDRTEDPTAKKEADAREKGQIPRSKELATATVLISSAVSLMIFGGGLGQALSLVMVNGFSFERQHAFDMNAAIAKIGNIGWILLEPLSYLIFTIIICAFIANIILGGMVFNISSAGFKGSKLNPMNGLKRMIGIQALVELGKSILKVLVIAGMAWLVLKLNFREILSLSSQSLPGSLNNALDLLLAMLLMITFSLLIIAGIDVPYQIWQHTKQLKMTKQEIKDEHKNAEGSPEVKGRIRRLQMEMASRRMMTDVPNADVIVTNPTHFSVALKYDQNVSDSAPIVVAKGADEIAFKIREIASFHEVPVIASPPLTRSLYHTTDIGHPIPDGLFVAVAQILAYVFQLEQFKKGSNTKPNVPKLNDLPIPADLRY